MQNFISAIIFGIVQGVGEFLPISSSGHLVLLHRFIELPLKNELAFDVALHLATFFAVFLFFYQDIFRIIRAWLFSVMGKGGSDNASLGWNLLVGTIPAALIGYYFEDFVENRLRSVYIVCLMLVTVAVVFLYLEKKAKIKENLTKLSRSKAFLIGLAQALALIPGTSRSGATIIAGFGLGLNREAAVRFSFLLSLPIILGASITKLPALWQSFADPGQSAILLTAFISAFASGYLAIRYFLGYVKKYSLAPFAWYRIILAVIILLIMAFR